MKVKIIIICTTILLAYLSSRAGNSIQPVNQSQSVLKQKAAVQNFGYFRVHRMGRDASLNWSVTDPAVAYFEIERSWDGSFFESISEVSGTGDIMYKFRDENCFPGFIYYRITAHNSDGSVVSSDVQVLHIVAKK